MTLGSRKGLTRVACILLLLSVSGHSLAASYLLSPGSNFDDGEAPKSLSGRFDLTFPLGIPPVGNLSYKFQNIDLQSGDTQIVSGSVGLPFHPAVCCSFLDLEASPGGSLLQVNRIYLQRIELNSGSDFYEYSELYLDPVGPFNSDQNSIEIGNHDFPTNVLLSFELHQILSRADRNVWPEGTIGPGWTYSVTTDDLLGTLRIQATVVPVPAAGLLFVTALGLLAGWSRRQSGVTIQ